MSNEKPNFYKLYEKVGQIDGKLDEALKMLKDHSARINAVEKIQDRMTGKMSVIGAIFGFIGGVILSIIRGRF